MYDFRDMPAWDHVTSQNCEDDFYYALRDRKGRAPKRAPVAPIREARLYAPNRAKAWAAYVEGAPLRDKRGVVRTFASSAAAEKAANAN